MKKLILFLIAVLNIQTAQSSTELCQATFITAKPEASLARPVSIPAAQLSRIESLRISEVTYEAAKYSMIQELKSLKLGVDEVKLAESLLIYVNNDKSAAEIIAQALHPKSGAPHLSDSIVADLESLRKSEIPYPLVEKQIKNILAAVGVPNAEVVAKAILHFKNNAKSVREIVAEASSSSVIRPSSSTEDLENLVMKTQRLEIRAVGPDKVQDAFAVWGDPQTAKMSGDYFDQMVATEILSLGQTKLAEAKNLSEPYLNFGIYKDGQLVGMAQVASGQEHTIYSQRKGSLGQKWASLSYHLKPSVWGQGIATEAETRLLRFAFETLSLSGLHAEAIGSNVGSIAILKKLGFLNFMNEKSPAPGRMHFYMDRAMYESKYQNLKKAVGN